MKKNDIYDRNLEMFEDELLNSLEGLEGNNLYDDIYNNEDNIIEDIFKLFARKWSNDR